MRLGRDDVDESSVMASHFFSILHFSSERKQISIAR